MIEILSDTDEANCEQIPWPIQKPVAYGIRNGDGYWCYIYKDRETAEKIVAKGLKSNKEEVVPLYEGHQL